MKPKGPSLPPRSIRRRLWPSSCASHRRRGTDLGSFIGRLRENPSQISGESLIACHNARAHGLIAEICSQVTGGAPTWRARNKLRIERVGGEPYRSPARPACRWRSRAAHTPPRRQSIYRRRTHRVPSSRSVRRKSPTSTWGRSMSSTRKSSNSANPCNLLAEAAGAAAAVEAARCEEPVEAVEAVAAAAQPAAGCGRDQAGFTSASAVRH